MSGWLGLAAIVGGSLALLWALKLRGGLLGLTTAALLFGAAGYGVQGRPGLAGAPGDETAPPPALPLDAARHAFFGTFTGAERWLILSDSFARSGDTVDAVGAVQAGLRAHPEDAELWVGLGNALLEHGRTLSPAARMAYDRAIALAPAHPGPRFFLGLAMMRSGDEAGALDQWRRALAMAPADASWRPLVEQGVATLEQGTPPGH